MNAKLRFFVACFVAVIALHAEELQAIPADEMAKATPLLMEANTRLGELPLKLELDAGKAMGLKTAEVGLILIPDKRLKDEKADKADRKKNKGAAIPVGQLWTLKLSPMENGSVVPNDRLRLVKVATKEKQRELAVYSLGIERSGKKAFQLALYAKEGSPVLRVPMTAAKSKGGAPVTLTARQTGEHTGVVELTLLGRYKAEIPFGKQAE